ncbi:MAG TPA: hypothetical protein VHZ74_04720 [Bryobacteraceae bacterium]|nr:hypothetical protein [Bryobacteraceae bacterium]
MRIRVPGLSRTAAGELGQKIANEVAAGLAAGAGAAKSVGAVHIRLRPQASARLSETPGEIARAILRSLR